tara:strand:+ start:161 stop:553 length:393 start_codon:yes stop_codon:yes gene_type:complete
MNKLYRAKNLENEWVHGYYLERNGFHWMNTEQETTPIKPETLSMWTGVNDKDGTPIYGSVPHIVKGSNGGDLMQKYCPFQCKLYGVSLPITYISSSIGFDPLVSKKSYWYIDYSNAKIIGNMIDNPELGE